MRKTLFAGLALATAAVGLSVGVAPAGAEFLTGWVLEPSPVLLADSHTAGTGAKVTSVDPLVVAGQTGGLVLITVSEPEESGVLEAYECNAPGVQPSTFVAFDLGQTTSNLVRLGNGPSVDWCFGPSGAAHVKVQRLAREGQGGGKNFVATPSSLSLFDAEVTVGTDATTTVLTGLSAGATDVSLMVTLPGGGSATVFGCGTTAPATPSVVGGSGVQSAALATLGGAGTMCVRVNGAAGAHERVQVSLTGSFTLNVDASSVGIPYVVFGDNALLAAPGLEPVTPERLFDTRDNANPRRAAGSVYTLDLSTKAPLDARSVVMNVTATDTAGPGYVTVYPCDIERPTASNLNYVANQTVPNLVTVALGASRKICFYTHNAAHLLADLSAWYLLGGGNGYAPITPVRLFDTRESAGRTAVTGGSVYTFDLSSKVDLTATAVTMNVTVTEPVSDGFLTVYPCDAAPPTASNLNYARNQTVPNLVTVKLSADHKVCFYAQKTLHLIADLAGSFEPTRDTGFTALPPQRLVDTRNGADGPLLPGDVLKLTLPLPKLDGALFNVTAVDPTGNGFITVYPCGQSTPVASNLNYVAGQTVANLVASQVNAQGEACFFVHDTTHLVVDLEGVYSPDFVVDHTPSITVDSIRAGAAPLVV